MPRFPKDPFRRVDEMINHVDRVFEQMDESFNKMDRIFDSAFKTDPKPIKKQMSHTIYICVPTNPPKIERMFAKIATLGVNVTPADKDKSLFAATETATTIMAVTVNNFNPKLSISQLLDYIVKSIKDFEYYGIVIRDGSGTSAWQNGNVVRTPSFVIDTKPSAPTKGQKPTNTKPSTPAKQADLKAETKKPAVVPEPQKVVPPKPLLDENSLELLLRVVEKSCDISDVFFDGISKDDRVQLSIRLKELTQGQT